MDINFLKSYLSRSQVREYLEYILKNGVQDISEMPDSLYAEAPVQDRIGSSLNSVKIFHVSRQLDADVRLSQSNIKLVSDNSKPDMPDGTVIVGIFYMAKVGRDYGGQPDTLGDESFQGDIGDVAWINASKWNDLKLGETTDGVNARLVVFWELEAPSKA
jgi:hypothetical protein